MKTLKRIDVGSAAITSAVLGAIGGLIVGVIFALFGSAFSALGGRETVGLGAGFGFLGIILFPIFYGIFGLIGGAIYAALYNLVGGWTGGLKVELE
jgi:hypothetical protein